MPPVCCWSADKRAGAILESVSERGRVRFVYGNHDTKAAAVCELKREEFYAEFGAPCLHFNLQLSAQRALKEASTIEPAARRILESLALENKLGESIMSITKNVPARPAALKPAKAEKPAKAPKSEKAPKAEASEGRGAPRKYEGATKITVLIKDNPHREGTARAEAFAAVLGSKTVGDYYAAGHKTKYLGDWETSGHIKIG